jgi:lipopolysaccharide export system protein LptA
MEMWRESLQKNYRCNPKKCVFTILLSVLMCIFSIQASWAQKDAKEAKPAADADRIHITSDRLISDNKDKTAEFIGNVKATQGDTVIVSDRLKVYYGENSKDKDTKEDTATLKRIVATGSVNIQMEDKVAVSEQAVYNAKTRVLVLTGQNSKITSEDNSVSGEKITLYRTEDRMVVEGSPKERVEAVLYSKDQGLN